ncbi:HesA/MoeB/ThiF family protein [Mycoplasmatota bacterium]|nr:HesA/MoeB/ThiF family protein [Mycoplasmatota bacterium]
MERYQRNMNMLSKEEIIKINNAKICVIGCGGLGGFIIEGLTRLGFEKLTIVDKDVFDETNLNRQLFSSHSNLGELKATTGAKRIKEINNRCTPTPINDELNESNIIDIIKGHDIVIDAVDNVKTKLLLQEYCEILNIPLVHGAIGGWYGQVAVILPGDKLLSRIYRTLESGIEKTLGNPSFTPAIIANFMVSEALKLYLNKGDVLRNKLLMLDLLSNELDLIEFTK